MLLVRLVASERSKRKGPQRNCEGVHRRARVTENRKQSECCVVGSLTYIPKVCKIWSHLIVLCGRLARFECRLGHWEKIMNSSAREPAASARQGASHWPSHVSKGTCDT